MTKTIVIADPLWGGHHRVYINLVANHALDAGFRVIALTAEPEDVEIDLRRNSQFQATGSASFRLKHQSPRFPLQRFRTTRAAVAQWLEAGRTIRRHFKNEVHLVFFPWLDSYLDRFLTGIVVDRLFPFPWSGLYFHPNHLRGIGSRRRFGTRWVSPNAAFSARRCKAVGVLDKSVGDLLSAQLGGKPVIPFPDYADSAVPDDQWEVVGRIKLAAQGRYVVGIAGSLERRKGILTALEAAMRLVNEPFFFVFAGQLMKSTFSHDELTFLEDLRESGGENCYLHFKEIPDEGKFNALIHCFDAVLAAYERFPHSSNLLSKAALFRKPVIVSKGYFMEEAINEFGIGIAVNEGDAGDCVRALRALREGNPDVNNFREARYEEYLRVNSKEAFGQALDKVLEVSEVFKDPKAGLRVY